MYVYTYIYKEMYCTCTRILTNILYVYAYIDRQYNVRVRVYWRGNILYVYTYIDQYTVRVRVYSPVNILYVYAYIDQYTVRVRGYWPGNARARVYWPSNTKYAYSYIDEAIYSTYTHILTNILYVYTYADQYTERVRGYWPGNTMYVYKDHSMYCRVQYTVCVQCTVRVHKDTRN